MDRKTPLGAEENGMNRLYSMIFLAAGTVAMPAMADGHGDHRKDGERMKSAVKQMDANTDGAISFDEFRVPGGRDAPEMRMDANGDGKITRQDAFYVAIKNWCSDIHGERGNRAGRRPPDAGQGFKFLNAVRKLSSVLCADFLRGFVKVAGPGVIAESRPQVQHLIHRRCRQCVHVGKARHETLIIGNDRGHLSLLKHDL